MTAVSETRVVPRLKTRYREEIVGALRTEFEYANVMQVPGVVKIVVNMGVGEAARDSKLIEGAIRDLTDITGQKPIVTKARLSIAQFKLREGMPIGAHVTLCPLRVRASVTSVGCHPSSSTAMATTPSVSRSRQCSPRLTRTRLTASVAWTSLS